MPFYAPNDTRCPSFLQLSREYLFKSEFAVKGALMLSLRALNRPGVAAEGIHLELRALRTVPNVVIELELIQTQMTQEPMLRA